MARNFIVRNKNLKPVISSKMLSDRSKRISNDYKFSVCLKANSLLLSLKS